MYVMFFDYRQKKLQTLLKPQIREQMSEPFLSTLQNMGVKSLQCVENFQQGEVLFVQAAYNFLHAAKMHFM